MSVHVPKRQVVAIPFFVVLMWKRFKQHQTATLTLAALATTVAGAVLFSLAERVSLFTAIYWAVTTVTTVGYGDVVPHNAAGRIIAMATMLTTIPLAGAAFAGWAASMASFHIRRALGMTLDKTREHLVVLGYSPLLINLLPDLIEEHQNVVLVADVDPGHLPPEVPCIKGDPTNPHVLAKAHLRQARQIVVVGGTDGEVLMSAVEAQHMAPHVPIFAITQSRRATQTLRELGITHSIAGQDLLGHTVAKSLETPHAADFLVSLLTSEQTLLREIPVPADWVGQSLSMARSRSSAVVLAVVHNNKVLLGVNHDPLIEAADSALVLMPAQ